MEPADGDDFKIERVSTIDQVAQRMRAMIADGRLVPGERLRGVALSQAFGVSRPTMRDAIRTLAAEGLVVHEIHRGAVVATLTATDVADIYQVRRALELPALESWETSSPDRRAGLEDALRRCEAAVEAEDYGSFTEHELELHAALVALRGSPRTDRFFAQLLGELRLVYSLVSEQDSATGRPQRLLRRYKRLIAALRRGRPQEAQAILRRHLDEYEKRLREIVES